MDIRLNELVRVSNNSILTNQLLVKLNEQLDDQAKRDLKAWLILVNGLHTNEVSRAKGNRNIWQISGSRLV